MNPSTVSRFDRDIGWLRSGRMERCVCDHLESSHRPISRKCSACDCSAFSRQIPPKE